MLLISSLKFSPISEWHVQWSTRLQSLQVKSIKIQSILYNWNDDHVFFALNLSLTISIFLQVSWAIVSLPDLFWTMIYCVECSRLPWFLLLLQFFSIVFLRHLTAPMKLFVLHTLWQYTMIVPIKMAHLPPADTASLSPPPAFNCNQYAPWFQLFLYHLNKKHEKGRRNQETFSKSISTRVYYKIEIFLWILLLLKM